MTRKAIPKGDITRRLTMLARRAANRYGAQAATYGSVSSFNVMTERMRRLKDESTEFDGLAWVNCHARDVWTRPAFVARYIRAEMKRLWG